MADVNSEPFKTLTTEAQKKNRIHLVLDTLDRNVDEALPPIVVQGREPNYGGGENVHKNGRDQRTLAAYDVLSHQLDDDDWRNHANNFLTYLTDKSHSGKANAIESEKCTRAIDVLTKELEYSFPGLMMEDGSHFFMIKKQINGFDVIGKLWKFCNSIKDPNDKQLAISSMIESILEFMNKDNTRVCQPGQLQRLMIGVVQDEFRESTLMA